MIKLIGKGKYTIADQEKYATVVADTPKHTDTYEHINTTVMSAHPTRSLTQSYCIILEAQRSKTTN